VNGVELANGYHELLDGDELERRNEKVNSQREADGHDQLPADSKMLEAMRYGMPACSGVALGVDRLLMVLLEKDSISDVIAFPFDRA
jgi:lysyl-tRNA synthetase class 2